MGLFGKLFDKKECAFCGGEIGLLGNRKLEDGNMCKECAKKLSPWFSERRKSTVEQIQEQLDYREANKEAVANFQVTRTLGMDTTKLLLDENNRKFLVTDAKKWRDANPDVLDFSAVTGCQVDVDEDRDEQFFEGPDGDRKSYNPPRYDYSYNFYIIIHVNNPYFEEIKFKVNRSRIEVPSAVTGGMGRPMGGMPPQQSHKGNIMSGVVGDVKRAAGAPETADFIGGMANRFMGGGSSRKVDPRTNVEYQECETICQEIKEALAQVRMQVREEAAQAASPKQAVTCPWCGATTVGDAAGCCEYCGGSLKE